ncbi:uncharacterized protein LOC131844531 [Achroia grisella]|uniref:uncharacterized protein LOC131844531 n=1 Tax=Achroia grisella TaxID=688607 RepID=UPI0027D338F5|nr:uncharacterized protein LOC131844531 [Achroia grisella]
MLFRAKCVTYNLVKFYLGKVNGSRRYSMCCPPRPPPGQCGCPSQVPGGGRGIVPPANCRPGPIAANPCMPQHYHGKDTWKKYKYIALFVCLPLIIVQGLRVLNNEPHQKDVCRDYEYMRIRTKRFPWGTGEKTFFHNDLVNHLPGDCEPPPLDCD